MKSSYHVSIYENGIFLFFLTKILIIALYSFKGKIIKRLSEQKFEKGFLTTRYTTVYKGI